MVLTTHPANGNSASVKMTIDIPLDVAPGPLPLTVTAYDNPGGGGTIIGTFTVILHVNQVPLIVQTSGLYSPTNVYINGAKVGTAYDDVNYSRFFGSIHWNRDYRINRGRQHCFW
jgi:hypothetical protein